MSNVIHLNVPSPRQSQQSRHGALLDLFSHNRRFADDVFWLKENAELLNILECSGAKLGSDTLAAHDGFYATVEQRMGFFPQYYRFLLSICLDLEDLGHPGQKGEALVHWAAQQGLADAELSDLQRAEARRLMARREVDPFPDDKSLTHRLHAFIDRSATFALPNKKAAYELTHIVFYLSEYGRRDPGLSDAAISSLEYAGILAYLDQNTDLLAEICVALRFAGHTPSQIWEDWIALDMAKFAIVTGPQADVQDDYHDYFVCNWLMAQSGRGGFSAPVQPEPTSFHRSALRSGPLRRMSECMFEMAGDRTDDWQQMRPLLQTMLSEDGHDILCRAEESTDKFDAFYAGFARTGLQGVAL